MDLIEIDAASNTSVDDVRELRDKINFSPSQGRFKVYIIDEVHMLSTAAFNALLKTLEEPPPHAIFVLATTEIHKIPATVLSRCQRHEFRRIPLPTIVTFLKSQCAEEDFNVDEAVFGEIARQATGSLRDAISLLDQLTSTVDHITLEIAQNVLGTATDDRVITLVDALLEQNPAEGLQQIQRALDNGTDPRQFARQIVTYLRNVLLYKMGNNDQVEVPEEVRTRLAQHASQFALNRVLMAIEAFNDATVEEHANWHPGLGLELAFTRYLAEPKSAPSVSKKGQENQKREKEKPKAKPRQKPTPAIASTEKATPGEAEPAETSEETIQLQDPPESPPPHPANEDLTLGHIHQSWEQVKNQVGQHNKRAEALLNSCRISALRENVLVLGFSSSLVKELMEKEGNLNLTSDILEEVYGQPLLIKCVVSSQESSSVPSNIEIDQDGMVGTATRDLGGKISKAEEVE